MTVAINDRRREHPGNGVATLFNGPMAYQTSHIAAYLVVESTGDTTQIPGASLNITLLGRESGTNVEVLSGPPATGTKLVLLRVVPISQVVDITNQGSFNPNVIERGYDLLCMQIQQIDDKQSRALQWPDTYTGPFNPFLPDWVAGNVLMWSITTPGQVESGSPVGSGDMLLRGDLASTLVGKGGTLVAAQQTGTGAAQDNLLEEYRRVVRPEQFGASGSGISDDSSAIQLALDRAIGGVVKLTPGRVYALSAAVQIPSNTTLDARGATIKRLAGINNMIRNKGDGVTGGYAQNFNMRIIGGTWTCDDAFAASSPCTLIGFTHSTGVWISGCEIINPTDWHHVEVNGCQAVFIDGLILSQGSNRALTTNEAIQIDANMGGGQWPWQGPADSTACTTVKITNCWFNNVGTGIGTHSGAAALIHNDIQIDGCTFFQPYYAGVHARGWSGVKVTNCRFYEGAYGVFMDMQDNNVVNDYLVQGNTFFRIGFTSFAVSSARAVYANGNSSGTQYVRNWRIVGNFVGGHTNAGKSTHALTMDYCRQGVFANNTCQDINRCAIWAFGCDRVNIIGNEVINANIEAVSAGIIAGGTGSVNTTRINISSNITDTMNIASCDRTIARNNIITTAAGLTSSGNTNTTVSENLTDTTFA